jgi:serine/threonine protein kinase
MDLPKGPLSEKEAAYLGYPVHHKPIELAAPFFHSGIASIPLGTENRFNYRCRARAADRAMPSQGLPKKIANLRLCDRFVPIRRIGSGAWATVYEGVDLSTSSPVAIKVCRKVKPDAGITVESFLREADILRQLPSEVDFVPRIPKLLSSGAEAGVPFIVTERIEGITLANLLRCERWLGYRRSAYFALELAKLLTVLHEREIQHRDIKPSNIIVRLSDLRLVLIDYGSALCRDSSIAGRGAILEGTLPYVAPEQLNGTAKYLNGQSDIFSVGVILYQMLAGKAPFGDRPLREIQLPTIVGSTAWKKMLPSVTSVFSQPPQPILQLRDVDRELADTCDRALAYDLRDRFRSAREFADALQACLKRLKDWGDRGDRPIESDIQEYRDKLVRELPAKYVVATPPRDDSPQYILHQFKHRAPRGITCGLENLEFSPDGRVLMSVAGECERRKRRSTGWMKERVASVRFWNVHTGREIAHVKPTPARVGLSAWYLNDGSIVAVDGRQVWRIRVRGDRTTKECVFDLAKETATRLAVDRYECRVAMATDAGIQIINCNTGESFAAIRESGLKTTIMVFIPQSSALLCRHESVDYARAKQMGLFDPHGDNPVYQVVFLQKDMATSSAMESAPASQEISIACCPNGQRVATLAYNRDVELREFTKSYGFKLIRKIIGHVGRVNGIAISPSGDRIATCAGSGYQRRESLVDATVRVWDAESGNELRRFLGRDDRFDRVAFSPDGKLLAASDASGVIRIWRVD